jgi:hypothetical protein
MRGPALTRHFCMWVRFGLVMVHACRTVDMGEYGLNVIGVVSLQVNVRLRHRNSRVQRPRPDADTQVSGGRSSRPLDRRAAYIGPPVDCESHAIVMGHIGLEVLVVAAGPGRTPRMP